MIIIDVSPSSSTKWIPFNNFFIPIPRRLSPFFRICCSRQVLFEIKKINNGRGTIGHLGPKCALDLDFESLILSTLKEKEYGPDIKIILKKFQNSFKLKTPG